MKIIFFVFAIGLLMYSCSRYTMQNGYQSSNCLQSDTVEIDNFIPRIESKFSNYADTSSKSVSSLKLPSEFNKDSSGHRLYPSPFSPTTTVEFSLQQPDTIRMVLYTFDGLDSCVVYSGLVPKGRNRINFIKPNMPSGIYYLVKRLTSGEREVSRFMLLK
jgi:hypothetical protein